jgi:hypothetical protein
MRTVVPPKRTSTKLLDGSQRTEIVPVADEITWGSVEIPACTRRLAASSERS